VDVESTQCDDQQDGMTWPAERINILEHISNPEFYQKVELVNRLGHNVIKDGARNAKSLTLRGVIPNLVPLYTRPVKLDDKSDFSKSLLYFRYGIGHEAFSSNRFVNIFFKKLLLQLR
jgi:hypothetical protein